MSQVIYVRPALTTPVGDGDHVVGPSTAPLTLVEYGDYECPFCGAAHPVVHEVQRIFGDELRFAYRHFPLSQIHPHAVAAAEAAEAAAAQGRFWEMHDLLFTHQDRLGPAGLLAHAQALGLDLSRFARELADHVYTPTVRAHFLSGVKSGVNGTPTFFINDVRHDGGYDLESLVHALRTAI
ncbi:MAG: DsbA family protein [Gaiellaceae bacterium]